MAPIRTPRTSTPSTSTSKPSSTLSNPTIPPITTEPTTEPTTQDPIAPQVSTSKKRKRKEKPHVLHQTTFRKPAWTSFHLCLVTLETATSEPAEEGVGKGTPNANTTPPTTTLSIPASKQDHDIDTLTVATLLRPPLSAYLGLTGASIPIDILHTSGLDVWIRVSRQDARAVRASLMGWVGWCGRELLEGEGEGRAQVAWRVKGEGGFVAGLGGGGEVFRGNGMERGEGLG